MGMFAEICRALIAIVFAISFLSKVRSGTAFGEFRTATRALSGLRGGWGTAAAVLVAAAESAVVLGLLATPTKPYAFATAVALLGAFTLALLRNGRSPAPVACRCFGGSTASNGHLPVFRNAVLLAAAACGLWSAFLDVEQPPTASALVLAAGAAVTAAGLIRLEYIVGLLTARI
jgi:hypothetical protein